MATEPLLLTPGPTPVPAEIRKALGAPLVHHRTAEFQALLKEVGQGLKELFGTQEEVYLLTSSGTGAMEAAVVNGLSAGDHALVIRGGKFGERWGEICEHYGVRVIPMDPPWGQPLNLDEFSQLLARHPQVKAVFATLCETSTAVTYDIRGIRKAMGSSQALLVVDAISGLLAEPFKMDAFGVDAAVCGSQKGLMLPPGLGFIAFGPRAKEAMKHSRLPRYYFDLRLIQEAWQQTDTPFTPAIPLIVGLAESIKGIKKIGLNNLLKMHRDNAKRIRDAAEALGLALYADPRCASNAVTAVKIPPSINGKELLKRLKDQYNLTLAGGQGQELSGKIFRIASMGAIGAKEIDFALDALRRVLTQMGWQPAGHGDTGHGTRF